MTGWVAAMKSELHGEPLIDQRSKDELGCIMRISKIKSYVRVLIGRHVFGRYGTADVLESMRESLQRDVNGGSP